MTFLHRIAAVGCDGDKNRSDGDAVLRIGSGHPRCRNADRRAERRADTSGHLHSNRRINRAVLGEQPCIDPQHRRLDVGRINNRSPDDHPRSASGMNESRTDQTARQGFGDGHRLAGTREGIDQSSNSRRGGVIHQAQPRIAFHTYSSPVHTVSATAAVIRNPLNQFIQSPSSAGNGASANDTAMACAVVLTLPPHEAA